MTKQATFKQKIRARMAKTGERYAAARLALLQAHPSTAPDQTVTAVPGYAFTAPIEHDTGLLASALAHSGVTDPGTGAAFTPARVFGLSGGIGFMYFLFEYQGEAPMMTFTCRSWSMPGPVVDRALTTAGVASERSETGSAAAARRFVDEALANGRSVHLTLDAASLPWWQVAPVWVGQMPRQANAVGRDGERYLLDVGAAVVLPSDVLARARAAARKERQRAITFAPGAAATDPAEATRAAVRGTAERLVTAPFKGFASNFGLEGLAKVARLAVDERDPKGWPRVFDTGPLAFLALTRAWECLTLELTPPAGGRSFYADFLAAARDGGLSAEEQSALADAEALARRSGERLALLADELVEAGGEAVALGVAVLEEVDALRRDGDAGAAARMGELDTERRALMASCTLGPEARLAAYARVGEAFAEVRDIETELQRALRAI